MGINLGEMSVEFIYLTFECAFDSSDGNLLHNCFQICHRLKDAGLVEEFDAEVNKKVDQIFFFFYKDRLCFFWLRLFIFRRNLSSL